MAEISSTVMQNKQNTAFLFSFYILFIFTLFFLIIIFFIKIVYLLNFSVSFIHVFKKIKYILSISPYVSYTDLHVN